MSDTETPQAPPASDEAGAEQPEGTPEEAGSERDSLIGDPAKLYNLYQKKAAAETSLRERASAAEQRLAEFEEANKTEQEKAMEAARNDAVAETKAHYEGLLRQERLKNLAAGKLNDPSDAVRLLDMSEFDPDDEKAMSDAIDALIKDKPYLAAKSRVPPVDQGPQGEPVEAKSGNDWLRGSMGR